MPNKYYGQKRKVNPVLTKKGRPSKKALSFVNEIKYIPKVFDKEAGKINFQALKIAIISLSKVLGCRNYSHKEIFTHPVITAYKTLVPITKMIIDAWIFEALDENEQR